MTLSINNETKKKILLVEDNLLNQKVAQNMLQTLGHHLDIASTGQEAVSMFQQKNYDLVFLDIGLPDIDGLAVAQKIRAQNEQQLKYTPIIAITAHARDEDKFNCLKAGIDEFLTKPVMMNSLIRSLERVTEQSLL